jgi:hypothetical protein
VAVGREGEPTCISEAGTRSSGGRSVGVAKTAVHVYRRSRMRGKYNHLHALAEPSAACVRACLPMNE